MVPEAKGQDIVIDGMFAKGEWNGAAKLSLSANVEVCFWVQSGNLYIGFRALKPFWLSVSEVYAATGGNRYVRMHASATTGESLNTFSEKQAKLEVFGKDIKDWTATFQDDEKGPRNLEGREYRISLKKLAGGNPRIAVSFAVWKENYKDAEEACFPPKLDFQNSDHWLELVLPGKK
jgi:hypothetical protein